MIKQLLLVCCSSLALPLWAADDNVAQLLDKLSHSHREISYQAVVTHQIDDQLASYKLIHAIVDGKEYEFLEPLDGESRMLVRQGHSLTCVHPADQLMRESSDGPIEHYYDIQVTGSSRVAGRNTVVLQIKPRDVYRLGYQLDVDSESGLPLRTEIRGVKNEVLERYQYAMFKIGVADVHLPATGLAVSHSRPLSVAESGQLLQQLDWRPQWVPAGFVLAQGPGDTGAAEQALSFTDGLALFTVFLEPLKSPLAKSESAMRHGASLVYSRALEDKPYLVTVAGEIPVLTARQVAKSIRWTP